VNRDSLTSLLELPGNRRRSTFFPSLEVLAQEFELAARRLQSHASQHQPQRRVAPLHHFDHCLVYIDPKDPLHCGIELDEPRNIWGVSVPPDNWDETAVLETEH
jgi:hypothetical protein